MCVWDVVAAHFALGFEEAHWLVWTIRWAKCEIGQRRKTGIFVWNYPVFDLDRQRPWVSKSVTFNSGLAGRKWVNDYLTWSTSTSVCRVQAVHWLQQGAVCAVVLGHLLLTLFINGQAGRIALLCFLFGDKAKLGKRKYNNPQEYKIGISTRHKGSVNGLRVLKCELLS